MIALLKDSFDMISGNGDSVTQTRFYMDNDRIRSSEVRQDYEFPILHEILRFHWAGLTTLPAGLKVEPRQTNEEVFFCVVRGKYEVKLLSSVFDQNLYQGAFEDLLSY